MRGGLPHPAFHRGFSVVRYAAFVFLLLVFPTTATARTWRVARFGGDFSILQHALDAASSGDTISIGPGRFDERTIHGPIWNERIICGFVDINTLTIIGSGVETIIGSEQPWSLGQGQTRGFEVSDSCSVLRLRHLALENFETGIMMGLGDSLFVEGCELRSSKKGIAAGSRFASIINSKIDGIVGAGFGILSYFQSSIIVDNILSTADRPGTEHIHVEGPVEISVENCRFLGAMHGVVLSQGSRAEIHHNEFIGQSRAGVLLYQQSSCVMADCVFREQYVALKGVDFPSTSWFVERVVFESVIHSTLNAAWLEDGYIRNCDLAAGDHGIVSHEWYPESRSEGAKDAVTRFDMRNNWWGTTDADSIAAMIYDYHDNDDVSYIIDYVPFLNEAVSSEVRRLGDVKSLFRN